MIEQQTVLIQKQDENFQLRQLQSCKNTKSNINYDIISNNTNDTA